MSLTESRFQDLVDSTQKVLENIFDDSGLDVDLQNTSGVLTVKFENDTQLIFSRQEPLRQLWLAARSGGFHFYYNEGENIWSHDTSEEPLGEMLARVTKDQSGADISFDEI